MIWTKEHIMKRLVFPILALLVTLISLRLIMAMHFYPGAPEYSGPEAKTQVILFQKGNHLNPTIGHYKKLAMTLFP